MLAIVMGISLAVAVGVTADLLLRVPRQGQGVGAWAQALRLTAPALMPAGSPGRHPETIHPAVDPRFAAGLKGIP